LFLGAATLHLIAMKGRVNKMDLILLLIGLCIYFEFIALIRIAAYSSLSGRNKLIMGLSGLIFTIIFIFIRNHYYENHGLIMMDGGLRLRTFNLKLKGWAVAFTAYVGIIQNIILLIIAIFGFVKKNRTSEKTSLSNKVPGKKSPVSQLAELLKLSPTQEKAFQYLYEHHSLTIDDFERLCPDAKRSSLEDDVQAMVKLGLMKSKGDKFIMT
jgi:hypothetical protein